MQTHPHRLKHSHTHFIFIPHDNCDIQPPALSVALSQPLIGRSWVCPRPPPALGYVNIHTRTGAGARGRSEAVITQSPSVLYGQWRPLSTPAHHRSSMLCLSSTPTANANIPQFSARRVPWGTSCRDEDSRPKN